MKYCFDLDGTLCDTPGDDYRKAKPYRDRIRLVNSLYDSGHEIFIHTARGSTTNIDWLDFTAKQLQEWGVKYTLLSLGKPGADMYIDDRAIYSEKFFSRGL